MMMIIISRRPNWAWYLVVTVLLVGCASNPPFDATAVETALTPAAALANPVESKGSLVIWGGTVVEARNLEGFTELEVLSYPLEDNQRPNLDQVPQGRFKARRPGYLETVDFAPGRQVTVKGTVDEPLTGTVGEASYQFAVVDVQQIELWNRRSRLESQPQVHFGIGVVIGN